jgi:hypothetical protein
MIRAEIDAGRYRAPAERFPHHGGDPDVVPDAASAGRTIGLLLREAR